MTWRAAFTQLAAISVAGVTRSYDLDDLPGMLPPADLPALVPHFPPQATALRGTEGFAPLTYDGAVWHAELVIDHVLYWGEASLWQALPGLITAADAYLEAVKANPTLGGTLTTELALLEVRPGIMRFGGRPYVGVRFRHQWQRVL
jgi:hypothetical protein